MDDLLDPLAAIDPLSNPFRSQGTVPPRHFVSSPVTLNHGTDAGEGAAPGMVPSAPGTESLVRQPAVDASRPHPAALDLYAGIANPVTLPLSDGSGQFRRIFPSQ
jgi:hypothetical protein